MLFDMNIFSANYVELRNTFDTRGLPQANPDVRHRPKNGYTLTSLFHLFIVILFKVEQRKANEKTKRDELNEKYLELVEKQREYFKTVKEFQEVCFAFCRVSLFSFSGLHMSNAMNIPTNKCISISLYSA